MEDPATAALVGVGQEIGAVARTVQKVIDFFVEYSFQLLGAAVILAVGWLLSHRLGKFVTGLCLQKKLDITLAKFLGNFSRIAVLGMVLVVVLEKFGVPIAPMIAAIGAGTLGVSLALQGPISNFGSGLVIVFTRPFVVGDMLAVVGHYGQVEEITLGFTLLRTGEGELVSVPNRLIVGEVMVNSKELRFADGVVGVAYGTDAGLAIETVRKAVESVAEVSRNPAPQVGIDAFADSAVNIRYRYWLPGQGYFEGRFAVNRAVWEAIHAAGIVIPFPQRDVHWKGGAVPGGR